jgi:threonine dehydrogenase-like Zn-dependent dehydrogenase
MKALTWHGRRDVRVDTVDDPRIEAPTDVVIRITSSGLCGSDLHLYEVLGPFLSAGDILGHEPMGIVEEVGAGIGRLAPGDRVVIPFVIACGSCFMCDQGLTTQCETTQVTAEGSGAALFGYTRLYGQVPGAQAEYLRVPHADAGAIKVPEGPPDDRFVYLSDVMPTAWQALEYAETAAGTSLVVLGLGPIGDMCTRLAAERGAAPIIGVDLVPERLARVAARGIDTIDLRDHDDLVTEIRHRTGGRGPDAVIDAVGMEAHGAPLGRAAQFMAGLLPDVAAEKLMRTAGIDRLAALHTAIDLVRRGGTVSVAGVYGGMADPLPLLQLFDKQVQLRMGQANVHRWIGDLLPFVTGTDDPLGLETFATHRLPLDQAPEAYRTFQAKEGGTVKVLFQP